MSTFAANTTASAPASSVPSSVSSTIVPSTTSNTNTPTTSTTTTTDNINYRLPEKVTLENAVKWAIIEDRPIMLDYWTDSLEKKVMIGVRENGEKLLVKNADEYTSPIVKIFKHNTDYIVMTENSIYLVDSSISIRRIS